MHVVTRTEWGARAPKPMEGQDTGSIHEAFIHHSDDPDGAYATEAGRRAHIRSIQDFHMDGRGWSDIAYHYVVFQVPAGIYAGRSAHFVPAAQLNHNTNTLAICVVGDGDHEAMKAHTRFLIEQIIGQYPSVRTIGGHRDVTSTDCPGEHFYRAIPRIAQATKRTVYKTPHRS